MNFINPVTLTANLTFSLSALWAKFVRMLKTVIFFSQFVHFELFPVAWFCIRSAKNNSWYFKR
jgi:hypothetical protein